MSVNGAQMRVLHAYVKKNYIADVSFNYFHSDFRKVPRIEAVVLSVEIQHRTTRVQPMYNT